jgi:sugar lactone lactonase YvrE
MHAHGGVEVLANTVAGTRLTFASNVVEASDGTVWFTVSSRRWDSEHFLGDFLEHSCTGLLVQRDPDGTLTVLLDNLKCPNGLVLAPDGSPLIFAESAGYRISRYWLTGTNAGSLEVPGEHAGDARQHEPRQRPTGVGIHGRPPRPAAR